MMKQQQQQSHSSSSSMKQSSQGSLYGCGIVQGCVGLRQRYHGDSNLDFVEKTYIHIITRMQEVDCNLG